jgi:hypothetical protein
VSADEANVRTIFAERESRASRGVKSSAMQTAPVIPFDDVGRGVADTDAIVALGAERV